MILSKKMIISICGEDIFTRLLNEGAISETYESNYYSCEVSSILNIAKRINRIKEALPYFKLCFVLGDRSPDSCETIFKDAIGCSTFNDAARYLQMWSASWMEKYPDKDTPPCVHLIFMYLLNYINGTTTTEEYSRMLEDFRQTHLGQYALYSTYSIFMPPLTAPRNDEQKTDMDENNRRLRFYIHISEEYALKDDFIIAWKFLSAAKKMVSFNNERFFVFSRLLYVCNQKQYEEHVSGKKDNTVYSKKVLYDLIEGRRWTDLFYLVTTKDLSQVLGIRLKADTIMDLKILVNEIFRINNEADDISASLQGYITAGEDDILSYEPKFGISYYIRRGRFVTAYYRAEFNQDPSYDRNPVYLLLKAIVSLSVPEEQQRELNDKNQKKMKQLRALRQQEV